MDGIPWITTTNTLLVIAGTTLALLFYIIHAKVVARPLQQMAFYAKQGFTGSPFVPLFGDLLRISAVRKQHNDYFYRIWPLLGHTEHITWFFFGPEFRLRVQDAEVVKGILSSHSDSFRKPSLTLRLLGPLLGCGLVLSEGSTWKRHRDMIAPAFHHVRLKQMVGLMGRATQGVVETWLAGVRAAKPSNSVESDGKTPETMANRPFITVDMHHDISALALQIIAKSAFGNSVDQAASERVYRDLGGIIDAAIASVMSLTAFIPHFNMLPTPSNLAINRKLAVIRTVLTNMIATRRAFREAGGSHEGTDEILLDFLLDARDAEAGAFTDAELYDEAMTFVLAGHETTSQALCWTMMLLSQHPEWNEMARSQVLEVMGEDGTPTYESLARMPILHHILSEAMRLYPPVPLIVRDAVTDVELPNLTIAKGTTVNIPIVFLHRDPRYWSDPDEFKPERWRDGPSAACSHPFAYLPFSHGPRHCIGAQFALQEAKIILAVLLQQVDFELSDTYVHRPAVAITLRPTHGMPMKISARAR